MLDGPLVFVDIDTQCDFLEPGGALYVPGSETIRPQLARLTAFARGLGIPILATACAHRLDDPDPEPFPPHCLVGTPGQRRVAETRCEETQTLEPDATWDADRPPAHLTIEKRRYDFFSHPSADRLIAIHAARNPIFVVYGVATDYCVKAAVEGLLDRGYRVAVVVDAIRAVDPAAEPDLLTMWAGRGALLTRTDAVCQG